VAASTCWPQTFVVQKCQFKLRQSRMGAALHTMRGKCTRVSPATAEKEFRAAVLQAARRDNAHTGLDKLARMLTSPPPAKWLGRAMAPEDELQILRTAFTVVGLGTGVDGCGNIAGVAECTPLANPADVPATALLDMIAEFVDKDSYIQCRAVSLKDTPRSWRWRFEGGQRAIRDWGYTFFSPPTPEDNPTACPVREMMGNKGCVNCPFGLLCFNNKDIRLQRFECQECGGSVIVRNDTRQLIARISCTCARNQHLPRWADLDE